MYWVEKVGRWQRGDRVATKCEYLTLGVTNSKILSIWLLQVIDVVIVSNSEPSFHVDIRFCQTDI